MYPNEDCIWNKQQEYMCPWHTLLALAGTLRHSTALYGPLRHSTAIYGTLRYRDKHSDEWQDTSATTAVKRRLSPLRPRADLLPSKDEVVRVGISGKKHSRPQLSSIESYRSPADPGDATGAGEMTDDY